MLTPIKEKKLAGFQEFEEWLDKEQLLNSDVLYRGHADSTWGLESTLYRHQLARFHDRHPSLDVPISKYTDVAKKLQAIVETHTDQHFDDNPRECDRFPNTTEQLSFRYAVYLRHRGFPSPLLDWSLSPYVAAYFAFIDVANRTETKNGNEDDDSRVALTRCTLCNAASDLPGQKPSRLGRGLVNTLLADSGKGRNQTLRPTVCVHNSSTS